MCTGLAYIMLVPLRILKRKQPMRVLLQSCDKLIYIWIYLSIRELLLEHSLSVHTCKYVKGFRINVGFITYEELSLLDKGSYIN